MPSPPEKAHLLSRNQEKARRWLHQRDHDGAQPEQLLDSLTEQITRRVRRECQALDKTDQKNVAEKLDSYLTENLRQTHTCPVCFEVMQPPHRSPQMLFPCGHTFCKACVAEHRSRAGAAAKACPVCQSAIESVAENRALRELIETFVGEKRALERGSRAAPELLRTGGGPRDYAEERDAAAVRRDVLAVELESTEEALRRVDRKLDGIALTTEHLDAERADVAMRLRALEAERDLVDQHIEVQRRKERELSAERRDAAGKIAILRETLASVEAQVAKAAALAEGSRR